MTWRGVGQVSGRCSRQEQSPQGRQARVVAAQCLRLTFGARKGLKGAAIVSVTQ
jgi:hypothetical protein